MTTGVQMNGVGMSGMNNALKVDNRFGTGIDIAQMMIETQMDQAKAVDDETADQMKSMQSRSAWLSQANSVMADLRTRRPGNTSDIVDYGSVSFIGTDGQSTQEPVTQWFLDNGVSMDVDGDNRGYQWEFDAAISNLKDATDTVNTQSQLDMTRLQGLMDKHNNLYQQMSNTLSSNNDVIKNILQKMGQ